MINYKPLGTIDLVETVIVMKFSTGDFLRVPMYIRQTGQLFETTPSIVDFGLI